MLEIKPLKRIMEQYLILLEKYKDKIENFDNRNIKQLIGEVRLFWYRQHNYIQYLLSNIEKKDNVTCLSGAIRLDIKNFGHNEYILVKGCRIINDPLLKMSTFYHGTNEEINFQATNEYFKECYLDLLALLREYSSDFFIVPLEMISIKDEEEYQKTLVKAAESMLLSFFCKQYASIDEMKRDNFSYEDIEKHLPDWIRQRLVFDSLEDGELSLRKRCENALHSEKKYIAFMKSMNEIDLFYLLVIQQCMRAIAIFNFMKNFRIMPFIRDDIAFQYFELLFNSSINDEFTIKDYLQVLVPYVLQKVFDFSKWDYDNVKHKLGNGLLIEHIINEMNIEEEKLPQISDIVASANMFIAKIENELQIS